MSSEACPTFFEQLGLLPHGGSLFDLISLQHGSFSRYWKIHTRSYIGTGARTPSHTTRNTTLFPSQLPWKTPPGKSRTRRGYSLDVRREALCWLHMLWALFNYLDSGSPASRDAIQSSVNRASAGDWTALHESHARTMYARILKYCALPRGTMERGTGKLNDLISRIQDSQYNPSVNLNDAMCGAKNVDPSRISLPERGGIIDPRDHLSGQQLIEFENMPQTIPTMCSSSKDGPACHKVEPHDWPVILRKLYAADMITFLPKSQVLAEGRRLIKGGLFCVPHKLESDRLINDRRPLNLREKRLGWCQLPAGPQLTQLILNREESVRASGDDLQNYFYLIKHLDGWQHRNCFGKPFKGSLLADLGLDASSWYVPAFKVLCMGDTNGVDVAQATHESLLRNAGCLKPSNTLIYGKTFPSDKTFEGLYIDDHLAFQVTDKKPLRDRGVAGDELLMHQSRQAYDKWNLPRSKKKSFDKEYCFKAWGTQVNSECGSVSTPPEKLRQIEALTASLLHLGKATKKSLQKLVGVFIHPFMHRRDCMCIFHHIYRYIDRMPEFEIVKIPHHIRDELLTAALLLPLAYANIRWPISIQIAATDASSTRGGRASCITSRAFAKTLYRFSEQAGEYTRLDWDDREIEPPTSMQLAPASLVDSLMKHRWVATQSCSFQKRHHINILELEMVRQEIKDRVNSNRGGCRVVNLRDSRVTVGAFAKGRSSSIQMNHRLRGCLPWSLVGNVAMTNLWVPTDKNPADYPSRSRVIPEPSPSLDDPLLSCDVVRGAQVYRTPGVQNLVERESHFLECDPVLRRQTLVGQNHLEVAADVSPSDKRKVPRTPDQEKDAPKPSGLIFREIFAGKAKLTQVCKTFNKLTVEPPVDYKHKGHGYSIPSQDITDDRFFKTLKRDAKKPNQLWHFGLPCGSFSILQHSNGGTRRKTNPQGNGTLPREVLGNLILERTLILIQILEKHGNWWTLENPRSSYVWLMPGLADKLNHPKYFEAVMHQCAYGLRLKDSEGRYGPCKKHTRFLGNLPGLADLSRTCSCQTAHVHAVGGVKTRTGWRRRSELAGHYPLTLCQAYAQIAIEAREQQAK